MATAKKAEAKIDTIEEAGFIGDQVDFTPRANYSLQTPQDAPTPETTERVKHAETANAAKIAARK
jgi:hypothetical protein